MTGAVAHVDENPPACHASTSLLGDGAADHCHDQYPSCVHVEELMARIAETTRAAADKSLEMLDAGELLLHTVYLAVIRCLIRQLGLAGS